MIAPIREGRAAIDTSGWRCSVFSSSSKRTVHTRSSTEHAALIGVEVAFPSFAGITTEDAAGPGAFRADLCS